MAEDWPASPTKARKVALFETAARLVPIPEDKRQAFADALDDAAAEWEIMRDLDTERTNPQLAARIGKIETLARRLIRELEGLTPEGMEPYDDTARYLATIRDLRERAERGSKLYGGGQTMPAPPHSADHALHALCRDMLKLWHDTFGEWPELSADRKTGKPFMAFLDTIICKITGRGPEGLYDKAKKHLKELRTQNTGKLDPKNF